MSDVRDVIIIGGGPAGYTAALYTARANLRPLVIEGFNWGGQLMITSDVENYPGYADGVIGPTMMGDFRRQAERFGAEFVTDDVTRVDFSERPFRVYVGDDEHRADSVIVATGASARQLGLPSERTLQGRGVSYCATCDGAFFRDKVVVVVGGGDSAMEEATFLTRFASKVVIVHRRDEFRASPIMVDRARENEKVEFVLNAVVDEVLGEGNGHVTGIRLRDIVTGETTEIEADGLFVAVGHDPNTALFLDWLDHDDAGYLVTEPRSTHTNIPGVFAAGDVQDHTYRQAVTAAGSGTMAALDAQRWLEEQRHRPKSRPPPSDARLRPHLPLPSRGVTARWLDLVDPTRDELLSTLPVPVDPEVVEILAERPAEGLAPWPRARGPRRLRLRRAGGGSPPSGRGSHRVPGGRPRRHARRAGDGAKDLTSRVTRPSTCQRSTRPQSTVHRWAGSFSGSSTRSPIRSSTQSTRPTPTSTSSRTLWTRCRRVVCECGSPISGTSSFGPDAWSPRRVRRCDACSTGAST